MLQIQSVDLKKAKIETLVIPVCQDDDIHDDTVITSLILKAKKLNEFKGKKDQEAIFYQPEQVNVQRVLLIGIGKKEKLDLETFREFTGKAVKKCICKNLSEVVFCVPLKKNILSLFGNDPENILKAMLEGAALGNHIFDKYKQKKEHKILKKIVLFVDSDIEKKYGHLAKKIEIICSGTILAREWVSTPSNDKRPEMLTKSITDLAKKENLTIHVMDEKELKKKKFGSLLSVSAGSDSKPRMIIMEYSPKGAKKTVALVGKGVTFDSGGINLKPSGSLEDMKMDMSGAAAVAATLLTVAKLNLKTKVIGIIPVVENMPSGKATRPGDIVRSFNGKTIEIGNTDAEGRLILIDAITYGIKTYKPDTIIDIATLTGACVIALGEKIAGVFSSDKKLSDAIIASGEKTHERCWHLPLPDDYKELLKSSFADIHNISSSRWGGAITAALFLSEFTGDTPWAHIDIAGPAYIKKESAYCGAGGTGFGVRLFCDLLETI